MKTTKLSVQMLICSSLLLGGVSYGASSFNVALDSATAITDHFTQATSGTPTISYPGTGTLVQIADDPHKVYFSTLDADYGTVGFTATITYTFLGSNARPYFGIGSGVVGGNYNSVDYNVAGVNAAHISWDPRDLSGQDGRYVLYSTVDGTTNSSGEVAFSSGLGTYGNAGTTSTAYLTWDPASAELWFKLDADNDGTVDVEFPLLDDQDELKEAWVLGADSKIVFGSGGFGDGLRFDSFSVTVIPEPSAVLLGGLGLVGLLRRRRLN